MTIHSICSIVSCSFTSLFAHVQPCVICLKTFPFQAGPFEGAVFLNIAAMVGPEDHVSERILEKYLLEAEIWPF